MKFHLKSAAKVNLSLDILGRRADGYHQLASVVHTVGIWDEIDFEIRENGAISFDCNREELAGDDNLCVRAVKSWNAVTGANLGAQIYLEKRIPTGAGLGGGSGNAAAILMTLNRAATSPLTDEKLGEIGAGLGADVPLFLRGGAVLMEGIGEKLTPLAPLGGAVLVVKPAISFATPAIYRSWDQGNFASRNDTPQLLNVWPGGDLKVIAAHLGNDLERAVAPLSAVPSRLTSLLESCGAIGARMSGSGSACFGVFGGENEARAAQVKLEAEISRGELAKLVPLSDTTVFRASFCETGVQIALL